MIDARRFHAENLVVDGLNAAGPQKDWALLARKADLDAMVATVGFMQGTLGTLREIEHLIARVEEAPDDLMLARSAGSIEDAFKQRKTAVIMCSQNTRLIEDEARLLDTFHAVGMRIIQLTYNEANLVGDGCLEERNAGLSAFGREVVGRMNRLGLIVDGSHTGKRTTMEAMELSLDPVIFSHSNARALRDHERNILNDQAVSCAATGGVVGVNGIGHFVGADDTATSSIVDHIDHYLDLMGAEHVGIGLDYFHEGDDEQGFNETVAQNDRFWPKSQYPSNGVRCAAPAQIYQIGEEMLRRNHSEHIVRGVLGRNFRRVARQVWK